MSNILLTALYKYYTSDGSDSNVQKLLDVLEDNNKVSLRIIDWFVTNYSKKHGIYYMIYEDVEGNKSFKEIDAEKLKDRKQFNTYHSYKAQLKSYSKKRFDPFCRRDRINFEYSEGKKIETTVGQLNFFKWAIDNLIIDYIQDNYDEIETDMNQSYHLIKKEKKTTNERKKRQELSKSASRGLNSNNISVVLDFN